MKTLFIAPFVLLAASTALGQLAVNPTQATLVTGQTIGISVSNLPGLTIFPVTASFFVSGPLLIDRVDTTTNGGKLVIIRALATGDGMLNAEDREGTRVVATFNVTTCSEAVPHVAMSITSRTGNQLEAWAEGRPVGGTYEWFSGAVGDTSRPITTLFPKSVWFYVRVDEPVQLWVRYSTPCGAAIATATSTLIPRRRSARP